MLIAALRDPVRLCPDAVLRGVGAWVLPPAGAHEVSVRVDGACLREGLVTPLGVRVRRALAAPVDHDPWRGVGLHRDGDGLRAAAVVTETAGVGVDGALVVELLGYAARAGRGDLRLRVEVDGVEAGCAMRLELGDEAPRGAGIRVTAAPDADGAWLPDWVDRVCSALLRNGEVTSTLGLGGGQIRVARHAVDARGLRDAAGLRRALSGRRARWLRVEGRERFSLEASRREAVAWVDGASNEGVVAALREASRPCEPAAARVTAGRWHHPPCLEA